MSEKNKKTLRKTNLSINKENLIIINFIIDELAHSEVGFSSCQLAEKKNELAASCACCVASNQRLQGSNSACLLLSWQKVRQNIKHFFGMCPDVEFMV